jgi:hypothetical protein
MKRWVVVLAAVIPALLLALLVAAFRSGYAQATAPGTPSLEVGKTYGFGVNGADVAAKVLAEPRGNWLQVEIQDEGKGREVWLNLTQVAYIQPDPLPLPQRAYNRHLPALPVEPPEPVQRPVP